MLCLVLSPDNGGRHSLRLCVPAGKIIVSDIDKNPRVFVEDAGEKNTLEKDYCFILMPVPQARST
jgi:hypothetical protein